MSEPLRSGPFGIPPKLSSVRIGAAFAVAVVADIVQLPITMASLTGILAAPSEGADLVVDAIAAGVTTTLLGFHWALLPTFFVELVPGIDLAPTWTGCVAYVVWQRKREQKNSVSREETERPLKQVTPSGSDDAIPVQDLNPEIVEEKTAHSESKRRT